MALPIITWYHLSQKLIITIELKDLALKSGVFSRFYLDENFNNNEYNKLYNIWIGKSITGEISFDIILAKDINILGFYHNR